MQMSKRITKVRSKIRKIISIIEELDGFRSGSLSNIEKIGNTYREVGSNENIRKWKEVRRDLEHIVLIGFKSAKSKRLFSLNKTLDSLYRYLLIGTLILIFFIPFSGNKLIITYIVFGLFIGVELVLLFKARVYDKIALFYIKNKSKYMESSERLRSDINNLLRIIRKEIIRNKLDPLEFKIRLINIDYNEMKILKKPGRFRRYYVAVVNLKR